MSNISHLQTQQAQTSTTRTDAKASSLYTDKSKTTNATDFFGMMLASFIKPTSIATPTVQTTSTSELTEPPLPVLTTSLGEIATDIVPTTENPNGSENAITDVLMGVTMTLGTEQQPIASGVTTPTLDSVATVVTSPGASAPATSAETMVAAQLAALQATVPDTDVDYDAARESILALAESGDAALTEQSLDVDAVVPTSAKTLETIGAMPTGDDAAPDQNIAAQLNAMTIGGKSINDDGTPKDKPVDILSAILQGIRAAQSDIYQPNLIPTGQTTTAAQGGQPATPTGQTPFILDPLADPSLAATSQTWVDPLANGIAAPVAPLSTSASKTQAASSAPSAQAAVQAVAIHLHSLGQTRDTRSLTLQLNPPELGKMQIKMTYGRDKTVKADILVEKSDTYQMMQKDSETLRTALTNAGLQADAGSLNFTLADHGTFKQNDTAGSFGTAGANDNGDDTIAAYEIKSSEEWSTDPSTGITRYNIWV